MKNPETYQKNLRVYRQQTALLDRIQEFVDMARGAVETTTMLGPQEADGALATEIALLAQSLAGTFGKGGR